MPSPADAEEHLRVIRSLMERATNYRAISAQGALVGGLLALSASGWMSWRAIHGRGCAHCEFAVWLIVLAITAAANLWFLWRDERRRGEPFFSPRLRWALRALAPGFLLAGAFTWAAGSEAPIPLMVAWTAAYAVSLLATSHFAPKSIAWLGRAFLAATLLALVVLALSADTWEFDEWIAFELYMGATFGLFHLIYALCTWPRENAVSEPAALEDPGHV